jgi:rubrerythrin
MPKPETRQDLAVFLHCSSILEEKVAHLYTELAQKVELPQAKPILLTIADESQKHSTALKQMSETIHETKVKPDECKNQMGEAWNITETFADEIKHKHTIPEEELATLAKNLKALESILGEKYAMLIHTKTLQLIAEDLNITSMKNKLKEISDDEKHHLELLQAIKKELTDKKRQEEDTTPTVRYQNPDSWIGPES